MLRYLVFELILNFQIIFLNIPHKNVSQMFLEYVRMKKERENFKAAAPQLEEVV